HVMFGFDMMIIGVYYIFFFFSSRRRHTRSYGDWSSDVCSSDLAYKNYEDARRKNIENRLLWTQTYFEMRRINDEYRRAQYERDRSEERRVGKECRCRRAT